MERAAILCNSDELSKEHFLLTGNISKNSSLELETYNLEELEKNTIVNALKKAKYNKAEAARLLNIEWNALYRRLQKYRIEL